jgi:hypothetical protein
VGLGVTGKSFFVYAQKFSAGLCIFPLQSSALLFCHTHITLKESHLKLLSMIQITNKLLYREVNIMATRGKSINLFLMDGTPNGRIKCTLANWTGVAYKIPRTDRTR